MTHYTQHDLEAAALEGVAALHKHNSEPRETLKRVALVYLDGFLPNNYKYRAPGTRVRVTLRPDFQDYDWDMETYDRKRSHGRGSRITLWKE
jgi:hypothetical protein